MVGRLVCFFFVLFCFVMFHSGLERQLGSGTSWRYLCDDGRPRRGQVWFGRRQETDDGPDPLDPRPYTPPDTGRTQLSRCWFASDLHLSLSLSLLTYPEFYFYFSLSLHLLLEILTVSTLNWFYNLFSLIFFDRVFPPPKLTTNSALYSLFISATKTNKISRFTPNSRVPHIWTKWREFPPIFFFFLLSFTRLMCTRLSIGIGALTLSLLLYIKRCFIQFKLWPTTYLLIWFRIFAVAIRLCEFHFLTVIIIRIVKRVLE